MRPPPNRRASLASAFGITRPPVLLAAFCLLASTFPAANATPDDPDAVSRVTRYRPDRVIGNSVDTATGAFVPRVAVLTVDAGRPLGFELVYNSRLTGNRSTMGHGWSHGFEASVDGDPTGVMTVHWDANHKNSFEFTAAGEPFNPLDEDVRFVTFERYEVAGAAWRITKRDGTRYEFSDDGKLHRVGNKAGQFLHMVYQAGALTAVEERIAGMRINLSYEGDLVSQLSDDLGREVTFSYDGRDRLVRVAGPVQFSASPVNSSFENFFVPDNDPGGASSEIEIDEPGTVGLVKLSTATWVHDRPEDLKVWLVSPAGTRALVHDRTSSRNANGKILDEFDGEPRAGTWRVEAADTSSGNNGQVFDWRMRFSGASNAVNYGYAPGDFPAAGRLTTATDLLGEPLYAITYDDDGRVLSQDDGVSTNDIATFDYAVSGDDRTTTYHDRVGKPWVFGHDDACRLTAVTDPLGNTTSYEHDDAGDRTRVTDPLGRTTAFTYDGSGNIATVTDPAGHQTTFTYDGESRNVLTITDALGKSTTFQYDGVGRNNIERVTDALGVEDNKTYNGNGQLTGSSMSDGAGISYSWTGGKMTRASHPGGNGDITMLYDAVGRLVRVTNPDGSQSTTAYSATGNITRQTDERGRGVASGYDHRDRLIEKVDRLGNTSTFTYDGNNNQVAQTNALGETYQFEFDGEDRLVRATDPAGKVTRIAYDAAGRLVRQIDGEGNGNTLTYDAAGNVVAVHDSTGTQVLNMSYDDRNLVTRTTDAFGHASTAAYDAVGRRTSVTDQIGRVSTFTYDALDRLTNVTDPAGRTLSQEFAGDDVAIAMTDGAGQTTRFTYDAANRLNGVSTPLGHTTSTVYTDRDLHRSFTTPSGKRYAYSYDEAGRLQSIELQGTATGPNRFYFYDDNGNHIRTSRQQPGQSTSTTRLRRTYDALDRLASFENSEGETVRYEYDSSGNLSRLVYPGGDAVTYTYDLSNRLTTVTDWAGRVTRYEYDANGQVTGIDYPNGTSRTIAYDDAGQPLFRADLDSTGAPIAAYEYSYSASGQMEVENRASPAMPFTPAATSFEFDADNRLVSHDGRAVVHDQDGNMTGHPDMPGGFSYDAFNNLAAAGDYQYTYDEEDHLIAWEHGGDETRLTIDPRPDAAQVLQKTDPDGTVTRYVYGIGLIYEATGTATKTFHYDYRGSTVALSDDTGTVTGNVAYGPYGEFIDRDGDTDTLFLFNGLFGVVTDPQGLNYMRFRWFWPTTKRFISQDAHFGHIAAIGSLNRYAFANGNPVSFVDPEGEAAWIVLGAATGATAATLTTLAVDIIDDGKINTPWEDYASAAIGGAVQGGILAACPTCAGTAGGAGAAAEYLTNKGLKGEEVDFVELAVVTATGAAIGKLSAAAPKFGGSKSATPTKSSAAKRHGVVGIKGLVKQDIKRRIPGLLAKVTIKVAFEVARREYGPPVLEFIRGQASLNRPGGRQAITTEGLYNVNAGSRGAYGEFVHWALYQDALTLADVPAPANPNRVMSSF